ncbi:probable transcription factor PosF21 isoform X1 [Olea europaea var. sylvestris]|uniref:probable transcription factor PosF21 isoform X1 n=1 Tax=Olea europaea var. sylvestris TaxID=158386 RepID=UPI000C1CE58A|nr:probable transcription factor PosF21 isoform X1 [Olea europaea var. sylvestris]XP_022878919.1 probable transcription factor PosF21 isoform X1 [Olea europaea var. sylvestris]XP_022878920.1 probable transcription factor PosF21 isoform X1 [Olea europaea var. sylvestris]
MDKSKSSNHGTGSLLPPSGRFSVFSPPRSGYNAESGQMGSSNLPPLGPGSSSEQGHFGQGMQLDDISQMPDNPSKNLGHRHVRSEILTLPDDISFDGDLGVVGEFEPSLSDETQEDLLSMYLDIYKFNSTSGISAVQVGESSNPIAANSGPLTNPSTDNVVLDLSENPSGRHQHSQSMDGSLNPDMLMSGSEELSPPESKKAASADKLAELALVDPKRAKRIWANRQSASRSKERKMRYIADLERKVQSLQTEATTLAAQLAMLQRDSNSLTNENSELKVRVETMEQQVHLQDALNDALKDEVQHLKVLTGQAMPNSGPMLTFPGCASFGSNQRYYPNSRATHTMLTGQQLQQLQIRSQKQQHQLQQHQLLQQQQARDSQLRSSMLAHIRKDLPPDSSSRD